MLHDSDNAGRIRPGDNHYNRLQRRHALAAVQDRFDPGKQDALLESNVIAKGNAEARDHAMVAIGKPCSEVPQLSMLRESLLHQRLLARCGEPYQEIALFPIEMRGDFPPEAFRDRRCHVLLRLFIRPGNAAGERKGGVMLA